MSQRYDNVMAERRQLVEKIIDNMRQGYVLPKPMWNSSITTIHNPISGVYYKGDNFIRLLMAMTVSGYQDTRWMTYKQAQSKGYRVKSGAKGVHLEKLIFSREVEQLNEENGKMEKVTVECRPPIINHFTVFNAEQIDGIPELIPHREVTDASKLADKLIASSECPITEAVQGRAYYSPTHDSITLPPRNSFASDKAFCSVLLHEMIHSTGHKSRLNRSLLNRFGTPEYALEELRAELGSYFMGNDLGIEAGGELLDSHTQYLESWIQALEDNPNTLFDAIKDSQKAVERLQYNLEQVQDIVQQDRNDNHIFTDIRIQKTLNSVHQLKDKLITEIAKMDGVTIDMVDEVATEEYRLFAYNDKQIYACMVSGEMSELENAIIAASDGDNEVLDAIHETQTYINQQIRDVKGEQFLRDKIVVLLTNRLPEYPDENIDILYPSPEGYKRMLEDVMDAAADYPELASTIHLVTAHGTSNLADCNLRGISAFSGFGKEGEFFFSAQQITSIQLPLISQNGRMTIPTAYMNVAINNDSYKDYEYHMSIFRQSGNGLQMMSNGWLNEFDSQKNYFQRISEQPGKFTYEIQHLGETVVQGEVTRDFLKDITEYCQTMGIIEGQAVQQQSIQEQQVYNEPIIQIEWSEHHHPMLRKENVLSFSEANRLFESLNRMAELEYEQGLVEVPFYKTKFTLTYMQNGQQYSKTERYDIGDDKENLLEFFRGINADLASHLEMFITIDNLKQQAEEKIKSSVAELSNCKLYNKANPTSENAKKLRDADVQLQNDKAVLKYYNDSIVALAKGENFPEYPKEFRVCSLEEYLQEHGVEVEWTEPPDKRRYPLLSKEQWEHMQETYLNYNARRNQVIQEYQDKVATGEIRESITSHGLIAQEDKEAFIQGVETALDNGYEISDGEYQKYLSLTAPQLDKDNITRMAEEQLEQVEVIEEMELMTEG